MQPVPDMHQALAMYVNAWHQRPAEERAAIVKEQREIRARLAQRSKRHAHAA